MKRLFFKVLSSKDKESRRKDGSYRAGNPGQPGPQTAAGKTESNQCFSQKPPEADTFIIMGWSLYIYISFWTTSCGLQNLSSPTRDQAWALGSERVTSQSLDCPGIPKKYMTRTHHYSIIQNSFIALKILCVPQRPRIAKAILRKKNEAGGIRFPDFRLWQSYTNLDDTVLAQNRNIDQ